MGYYGGSNLSWLGFEALGVVGAKTNYHSARANLGVSVCKPSLELWVGITNTSVCVNGRSPSPTCPRVALTPYDNPAQALQTPRACEDAPRRVVTSPMAPDVASMTSTPSTPALKPSQKPPSGPNVLEVVFGSLLIQPWYPSFYPEELVGRRVERLYVCQWCFKYSKELAGFIGHLVSF